MPAWPWTLANVKAFEKGPELLHVDILGVLQERERRVGRVDLVGWSEGEWGWTLCHDSSHDLWNCFKATKPMGSFFLVWIHRIWVSHLGMLVWAGQGQDFWIQSQRCPGEDMPLRTGRNDGLLQAAGDWGVFESRLFRCLRDGGSFSWH